MGSKRELKVKVHSNINNIISHLETLIGALREGKVVVESNNQFITLTPGNIASFEIEAEQKKDKETLTIELGWRHRAVEEANGQLFSIFHSKEPEALHPEPQTDG